MRYEISDYERTAIKPMLPNKPRDVRRVNDRRVLNGIFWVLRSGAPWRDLPESYGRCTTCYNRFTALATGWHLGPDHGSGWPPLSLGGDSFASNAACHLYPGRYEKKRQKRASAR